MTKSIVMIVAFRDFRDEEYFIPKEIFEKSGIKVKTASAEKGTALGNDGGEAEVDFLLTEINPAKFDAIIFVGGSGALKFLDNENSYNLINDAFSKDKILAAICIAPVILANAGVLRGKKATVWSSAVDKSAIRILKDSGVIYENEDLAIDGKIITASGAHVAGKFAENIVKLINA